MSTLNELKCLIELNNYKYNVSVDNNTQNEIKFKHILEEIMKIDFKLNITFKTHVFELFDVDFNEYVVIRSERQIIKNLSRIRVSAKHKKSSSDENDGNEEVCDKSEDNIVAKKEKKMSKDMKSVINASNKMSLKSSNSCIDLKSAQKRIKIENEDFCEIVSSVPVTKYIEEVIIDSEDDTIAEIYQKLNQNRNANNKTKSSTNKPLNANSTQSQTSVFDNNSLSKRIKLEKHFIDEKQNKFKINRTESLINVNTLTQSSQQLIPSTSTQTSYQSQTQTYSEVNNNLNPINLHSFSGAQTISHSTPTLETQVLQFYNKIERIDKMLIIKNLENCNDIQILTAIKQELEKMSSALKEEYYKHGIRLNDGFGINAYLCLKCNFFLKSLLEVIKHLQNFGRNTNEPLVDSTTHTNEQHMNTTPQQISSTESRFRSKGIFSCYDNEHKTMKYCCVFCDLYFETEEALNLHLNGSKHSNKAFRYSKNKYFNYEIQNFNEQDFKVKSQRINEYEVKFAIIKTRSIFEKKFKKNIKSGGIRLKDCIGSEAFCCLKCNYSLAVYSIRELKTIISLHLKSRQHLDNCRK